MTKSFFFKILEIFFEILIMSFKSGKFLEFNGVGNVIMKILHFLISLKLLVKSIE